MNELDSNRRGRKANTLELAALAILGLYLLLYVAWLFADKQAVATRKC